ncbi:MAG: hypothetical protein MJ188_11115 [Treponema sp.]|nr:hypothetical protein [Treponema sp.]
MNNKGFTGIISFLRSNVTTDDIIKVMRDLMFFNPTSFRSNLKDFKRLGKNNFWEQVRLNLEQTSYFRSYAKDFKQDPIRLDEISISFFPTTNIVHIRFVINTENDEVLNLLEKNISCFVESHVILSASLRSIGEYNWNDNSDLELQKRNHKEIEVIQTIQIAYVDYADVRQFSGHTQDYEGVWFGCSYEMWFGEDYNKYISLDIIKHFDDCEQNVEYKNGTVFIKMFRTYNDYDKLSSMERAFMFRRVTKCDEAFSYWKNEIDEQSVLQEQYSNEIEKGLFPHGGIRRMKIYLDKNNNQTVKAKAAKVHVSELGNDGKLIYEEIIDL